MRTHAAAFIHQALEKLFLPSAGSKTVNKSFLSSSGSSSLGAIIKILHKELRNFMFCVQLVSKIKRDLKRPKRP